jgi:hypothetical protein
MSSGRLPSRLRRQTRQASVLSRRAPAFLATRPAWDANNVPADDDFEDEIERAVDDKREGVLAADVTGMVQSEGTRVVDDVCG